MCLFLYHDGILFQILTLKMFHLKVYFVYGETFVIVTHTVYDYKQQQNV